MSSDEEVPKKKPKYERLLNDPHVNRLKFLSSTEEYQFNLSDLQREEMICINNNAIIEHYTFRPLKFPLAVKSLFFSSQRRVNEKNLEKAIEEVKILQKLSHDINIIDYYGYALDKERVWIFMELMETSLEHLYRKFHEQIYQKNKSARKIVIPEDVVGVIAVCILDALAFCKKQRVMHRDVKPRNVLVNKKGQVKLCDFGESKILESESNATTFKGTLHYLPPEKFEDYQQSYDERADIWSLGITLVEITYGSIPYETKELHPKYDLIRMINILKNADGHEIMSRCFNKDYSEELRCFIESCLNRVSSRPKYLELMERTLYKSCVAKNQNRNIMELFIRIFLESLNIEENPLNISAYFYRGYMEDALSLYNEAVDDLTQAIELNPTVAAYYNRGITKRRLGLYNEAVNDYTKAIELNPTYTIAYNNRGLVKKELGLYNEAVDDFTRAIELNPTYTIAYNNRGLVKKEIGLYNEAVNDFTKAIELNSTYADAYYNRGITKRRLGLYNEAADDYTKAIELNPTYAIAYNSRGLVKKELGSYNEAIDDYTKTIELNPTYAIAYNNRGLVKKELGLYNEAVDDYTKAIELNSTYTDAYNNRGITKRRLGLYNEAADDYTKAIELNPTYAIAYNSRGLVKRELGLYNEAVDDLSQAIELNPTYASYYNRGITKEELGLYNEAADDYTKAIELNPTYADAYINRGVAKEELG